MKIRNRFMIVLALLTCAGLAMAAVKKETRQVGAFESIWNSGGIDVYYTQSSAYSVAVEADEDVLDQIITEVKSGALYIKRKAGFGSLNLFNRKGWEVKVHVTGPSLREIHASGGSDFFGGKINNDGDFSIELSGGSDVNIDDLQAGSLVKVSASGGADCNIRSMKARDCDLHASGGADIKINVNATGTVSCSASGGADIDLSGKAESVKASASGGGDINIRKLSRNHSDVHSSGGGDVTQ